MPATDIALIVTKFVFEAGIGATLVKIAERYIVDRRQGRAQDANLKAAAIYDELSALRSRTKAGRVLLMYTSNGGGIPDAGRPIFCSILYEVAADGRQPIRHDWQNIPIDEGYAQLLREVIVNRGWRGKPTDLKQGFLQNLYLSEGVHHATVVPVYKTERQFYYLSLRWHEGETPPSDATVEVALTSAVGNITRLLGGNRTE